jgi:hypothetical protein
LTLPAFDTTQFCTVVNNYHCHSSLSPIYTLSKKG